VRALREEGEEEIPLPYVTKNQPFIAALKPFAEVYFPTDTADIQRARVVFRKEYVTATELQARIFAMGYDAAWVDEVVSKCRGQFAQWDSERILGDNEFNYTHDPENWNIEIIHAVYPQVDEDGVRTVSYTVFHPFLTHDPGQKSKALYGYHGPLNYDHQMMPYVVGKHENRDRRLLSSRGVPALVATRQRALKVRSRT
jgi:hypothetical protein